VSASRSRPRRRRTGERLERDVGQALLFALIFVLVLALVAGGGVLWLF
jgi:hypothetical protein